MTSFVYTTYIHTSPKKLWRALTEPAKTKKWWNVNFTTDWKPGSTYAIKQNGVTIVDAQQVVLESEPHVRLRYTWHSFTAEWADVHGHTPDFLAKVQGESRSKVAFDIVPVGDVVRLQVTHDGFKSGSTVLKSVRESWPPLLSSLKTLLETGEPLPR